MHTREKSETTATLSQKDWCDRFASVLQEQIPAMSAEDAATRAGESWPDARDLSPDEAAWIYSAELPPRDVGAPGDS